MPMDLVIPNEAVHSPEHASGWATDIKADFVKIRDRESGFYSPNDYTGTDTARIQAAINAAFAAGGGDVQLEGAYTITASIIIKPGVHLYGRGMKRTKLTCATDFGTNVWAIDYDPANLTGLEDAGSANDLSVHGPGGASLPAIGARNCNMGGVRLGSSMSMRRVGVRYFGDGLLLPWDHCRLDHCYFQLNYDGILLPNDPPPGGGTGTGGDHWFSGGGSVHNKRASLTVQGGKTLFSTIFENFKFNYGPIGLYRPLATSSVAMLASCLFRGCSWENFGNAIILDESTGGATGANTMTECIIENAQATSNPQAQFRDPAIQVAAACIVRNMRNVEMRAGSLTFPVPSTGGTHVWQYNGVAQGGVKDQRSRGTVTGGLPVGVGQYVRGAGAAGAWTVDCGDYIAEARYSFGTTIEVGDLLQWVNGGNVARLTTGSFAGVALSAGAAVGDIVLVAPAGERGVPVLCEPVTAGNKLYRLAGTTHHADDVVNGDPIGVAMVTGGGAGGVLVSTATTN